MRGTSGDFCEKHFKKRRKYRSQRCAVTESRRHPLCCRTERNSTSFSTCASTPGAGVERQAACPLPRGGLTLYVFLPRSCCAYPTRLGRRATARNNENNNNNNNNTIPSCRGLRAIIAPRAVWLILSGIPLSLISSFLVICVIQCTTLE